jgi:hypothetical protein
MYFPRNREFGSALSKLLNIGGGGFESPNPPRYPTGVKHNSCEAAVSELGFEPQ